MSNQSNQQPAYDSAPDASAKLSGDHVPDVQTTQSDAANVELEVGSSHWSESDSDSDYEQEDTEEEFDDDDAATKDPASTMGSDDGLDPSNIETQTTSECVAIDTKSVSSGLDDLGKEKEEARLDQGRYESYSAADYLALLPSAEATTSGAEDSAIDQALFENFDVDNSTAIAQHQDTTNSNEKLLADNFDADNSDLVQRYYGSNEAQGDDEERKTKSDKSPTSKAAGKQKAHKTFQGSLRPFVLPAVHYDHKRDELAPARKHGILKPSSPGWNRRKRMGMPFARLPPLPSPLNPHAAVTPPPSSPAANYRDETCTSPRGSTVSPQAKKQVNAHKPKFSFEEPRAAPAPAGGTKHRRAGAVCDTVIYPESLLSLDEVLGLTGISRESSRAFVMEYKAAMKAMDSAKSQAALNIHRSKLNKVLAGRGEPPVAASLRDRAARVAGDLQERPKLINALLHEYHESYGQLHQQASTLFQRLKTAEKNLHWINGEHRELEKAMLDVQKELEECFVDRRADREAHEEKCRLLQEQYDRLRIDTARLEKERLEATESLQSLQEAFDTQQSSEQELKARLGESKARIEILESAVDSNKKGSDPQQQVYTYEGQRQLHEHQLRILQLQKDNQELLERQARLTAVVEKAHKVVQNLDAEKTALVLANESLQKQAASTAPAPAPAPIVAIAGISIEEPAKWAQRRAAWRQTPEWQWRRELLRQKAQQECEARVAC